MPEIKDKQYEKERAAIILDDKITMLRFNLERAETVLQEITVSFFNAYDSSTEDGRFSIVWEYERYGIFADIVSDYLFKMRKELQDLSGEELAAQKR